MKSFKFEVEKVKCNGISGSIISKSNANVIETYVSTYRQLVDFSDIVNEMEDDGWDHHYGSRCRDNSSIAARITSGLSSYAIELFESDIELASMWINAQVEMFSGSTMTALVKEALRDCSSADHWYTFEKEWE